MTSFFLRNRIALLQKEEDRSRRKIEQTKERALEILALRDENERRMQSLIDANEQKRRLQQQLHERNITLDQESRKIRSEQALEVHRKKKDEVNEVQEEKNRMRKEMLELQRIEYEKKKQRRALVRQQEEEARKRREDERREQERRTLQYYATKAQEEEAEARRAERLVKELERKEKEWIERLRNVQEMQETAFVELEDALQKELMEMSLSRMSPGGGLGQGASGPSSARPPMTAMSSKSSSSSSRRARSSPAGR